MINIVKGIKKSMKIVEWDIKRITYLEIGRRLINKLSIDL